MGDRMRSADAERSATGAAGMEVWGSIVPRLRASVVLTCLGSVRLKHQLCVDGDLDVVSYDDAGALARELPSQAKVLPID